MFYKIFMCRARRPVQCLDSSLCSARGGFTQPLDSSCTAVATSSTTVESILFFLLLDCSSKEPVFSNFWIIFSRPCTVIRPTPFFFNILKCLEFLQSYWCTVIVLVKKLYKQNAVLQWGSHGENLRQEMKKIHVCDVFITSEMNIFINVFWCLQCHLLLKFGITFLLVPYVFPHLQ